MLRNKSSLVASLALTTACLFGSAGCIADADEPGDPVADADALGEPIAEASQDLESLFESTKCTLFLGESKAVFEAHTAASGVVAFRIDLPGTGKIAGCPAGTDQSKFAKCDASFIKEPGNAAGILTYKAFFFFKDYPVPQDEASGNCEIATDN